MRPKPEDHSTPGQGASCLVSKGFLLPAVPLYSPSSTGVLVHGWYMASSSTSTTVRDLGPSDRRGVLRIVRCQHEQPAQLPQRRRSADAAHQDRHRHRNSPHKRSRHDRRASGNARPGESLWRNICRRAARQPLVTCRVVRPTLDRDGRRLRRPHRTNRCASRGTDLDANAWP